MNSIGKALQYYEMEKGVQKTIRQNQLTKNHREDFKARFEKIGDSLGRAKDSYNKANTHLGNYSSSVEKLMAAEEKIAIPTESPVGLRPPV